MARFVGYLITAALALTILVLPEEPVQAAPSVQKEVGPVWFGLSDWEVVILEREYQIHLFVESVYDQNVGTSVKFRHVGAVEIVRLDGPSQGYLQQCEPLEDFYCVNWVVPELAPGERPEFVITAKALGLGSIRSRGTIQVDYRKEGIEPVSRDIPEHFTLVCPSLLPIGQSCP